MKKLYDDEVFNGTRYIKVDGHILYCGEDIAKALEYTQPNKAVEQYCKYPIEYDDMLLITEGDIYRLIMHSNHESFKHFETWVFDEVLPTLRTSGEYALCDDALEELHGR